VSYSGAGLYDDDAGADVRNGFREFVADGLSAEAATNTLIEQWGTALDDHDEACAFWLALADTQWKVGRLEDRVRDKAVGIIASGEDLARFEHDAKLHKRRRAVLEDLERQLAAPQRRPVRIRRPFRSVSPVQIGDVFSVELADDRVVFMRCVGISGDERDNQPTVEVLDWFDRTPPPDPGTLGSRQPLGNWADLFWLVRYPRDPDPAERITIAATGTPVTRRRTLPAQMVPWTDLAEAIQRTFGG
jgi:hypothetical protein